MDSDEKLRAVLDQFKASIDALAVGLLDRSRAHLPDEGESGSDALGFWGSVHALKCLEIDGVMVARLKRTREPAEGWCKCGAHALTVYPPIHGRWVLVALTGESLLRPAAESELVVTTAEWEAECALTALSLLLAPAPGREAPPSPGGGPGGGGGGSAPPAELGIPVWWARKAH